MSENEKQNLTENDCESDDEQIVNLEVETATSDKTDWISHGSSSIANHDLKQPKTKGTDVLPNDVIIVKQLLHESLSEKKSGERLDGKVIIEFPSEDESENASFSDREECKVTYEFLNDHGSENISLLSEACVVLPHKIPQASDYSDYRSVPQIIEKPKVELIKVFNSKTLNEESSDDSERKRKKDSISLLQNKKQKEVESCSTPVTHSACDNGDIRTVEKSDNSSDEFADIEDNVKESSSSDNSDSNAIADTAKQMPMKNLDAGIQCKNEGNDEPLDENKTVKINYEASSSSNSPNETFIDKAANKSHFPSSVKGEKIPVTNLSVDLKDKFEISMPTILEVRESENDEQRLQPNKSYSNPLIMKTTVVKRKDRCNVCNARLGLCAIRCRCGGYYCAKHRYDKEHNCTFDYKSMGAAEIKKNNPRVVAEKVRKL